MIPANELRIGNKIISIFNIIETVRSIHGHEGYKYRKDIHEYYKHIIGVEENVNQYNLAEIKPIPLTEEILLKCGLNKEGILYEKEKNSQFALKEWQVGKDIEWIIFWGDSRLPKVEIKYLHQLQNLYFALTGIELNYKP